MLGPFGFLPHQSKSSLRSRRYLARQRAEVMREFRSVPRCARNARCGCDRAAQPARKHECVSPFEMVADIRRAVDRAAADENAVGIIITGTGRAFSAGLDTTDLARSTSGTAHSDIESSTPTDDLPALFSYLLRIPKPVIAAVNGVAAGGGFVLAMMCDLRFASESASFTTVFSKRGLIAEHGTSYLLPRLVGTSRALDLLWSSRRFDAAEALRIGFVDRVVPERAPARRDMRIHPRPRRECLAAFTGGDEGAGLWSSFARDGGGDPPFRSGHERIVDVIPMRPKASHHSSSGVRRAFSAGKEKRYERQTI